jgi:hypothetical protein
MAHALLPTAHRRHQRPPLGKRSAAGARSKQGAGELVCLSDITDEAAVGVFASIDAHLVHGHPGEQRSRPREFLSGSLEQWRQATAIIMDGAFRAAR